MKVRYLCETEFLVLTHNQIYEVISIERGWYRIIDDSEDDYLYPPDLLEITDYVDYERLKKEDNYRK